MVWQLDDNGKELSRTVIIIDSNSEYTDFQGGFSETVVGGVTGQVTTTVENVSSGDSIEVCGKSM